ncbi:hypothetical protein LTR78_005077 [Recurvomyces mirabilis]|uniref:Major facilitator superfamily (MFS) profile domain-containing protein n=1 Tax=Recurvomyces mirabilis TaxID=574656 RepID=A0AAE0WNT1_9PEZI|nr:hypothetical protein LTR78_005077 [Recurvomyces mirabilis]KAK5158306.1 hypothetical protein LTS14_003324 [Recurvomyces mirabilis]
MSEKAADTDVTTSPSGLDDGWTAQQDHDLGHRLPKDPNDPFHWPNWRKQLVLWHVSMIPFLALFSASLIVPTFVPLGKYLHTQITETAYVTSIYIALVAISPLIWNPMSNVYGRRPIYIMSLATLVLFSTLSGWCKTYHTLLVLRALTGLFGSVSLGLGNATVTDLFAEREGGRYMGVYTVSFITRGHVAPIIGGYIEKRLTWRFCFYLPAILAAALLFSFLLTVPETLYVRRSAHDKQDQPPIGLMHLGKALPDLHLRVADFSRPLRMLFYPSVTLPMLNYSTSFGYGSILFILTSSNLFAKLYKYKAWQTGVLLGVPLTVGSVLGEFFAGYLSDLIAERRAKTRGGLWRPEDRFIAILPGFVLLPLGIIIEGVCITRHTHPIGPAMGIAVASFGLQIITTVVYAYTADCHRPRTAEVGAVLNFGRQVFSFCIGFYGVQLGEEIGFQSAWGVFAAINIATGLPNAALMVWGEQWRASLGESRDSRD